MVSKKSCWYCAIQVFYKNISGNSRCQ